MDLKEKRNDAWKKVIQTVRQNPPWIYNYLARFRRMRDYSANNIILALVQSGGLASEIHGPMGWDERGAKVFHCLPDDYVFGPITIYAPTEESMHKARKEYAEVQVFDIQDTDFNESPEMFVPNSHEKGKRRWDVFYDVMEGILKHKNWHVRPGEGFEFRREEKTIIYDKSCRLGEVAQRLFAYTCCVELMEAAAKDQKFQPSWLKWRKHPLTMNEANVLCSSAAIIVGDIFDYFIEDGKDKAWVMPKEKEDKFLTDPKFYLSGAIKLAQPLLREVEQSCKDRDIVIRKDKKKKSK